MLLKLKACLLERRMFGHEVARQVGMTETRFSRIVVGRIVPTLEEKKAIAKILRSAEVGLFPVEATSQK